MIFIYLLQFCILWHQFFKTCLWEPNIGYRVLNAVESPLVHLEIVKVTERQISTPLVCTIKRAIAVKVDHSTLTILHHRSLIVNNLFLNDMVEMIMVNY